MIKSMTGYGRQEGTGPGGTVTAELRSVNHRFLEVVVRLPRSLAGQEEEFKRIVQAACARGRLELTVSISGEREGEKVLTLNRDLARQYVALLKDLQRELRLSGKINIGMVAGLRDLVVLTDRPVAADSLSKLALRVTRAAVKDLDAMRRREGDALEADLRVRLRLVQDEAESIARRAPGIVDDHFARMKQRLERLLQGQEVDPVRLSQELALYAERSDISEEVTRLRSHFDQFERALRSEKPVGRTLDFLLQEMGREVNTIGSKANDTEVGQRVVRIKTELEKIREQVQNIE